MNISVVIPMYNREKTIECTISSVLKQTVQPVEIIVIDDCSTDGSVGIVQRLCRENRGIRLRRLKKNCGAQAARNCGVRAAKGEWILFLDSDDELTCDALQSLAEAAEQNPGYDVYYGDYYRRENNKKRYINCRMNGKNGNFFQTILFSSKVLFQNSLIRKKALEEIGLLDPHVPAYQEWDTHIRLSLNHRYCYVNKPVFIYNLHEGETISKNGKKEILGFRYVMMKNRSYFFKDKKMKGIVYYYSGMHFRCKRHGFFRQYYYLWMAKFLQLISRNRALSDRRIK